LSMARYQKSEAEVSLHGAKGRNSATE